MDDDRRARNRGALATQRSVALPVTVVYGDADLDAGNLAELAVVVTEPPTRHDR
ncbi:MAG: hypothetical protein H0X24_09535 [Ktedonobacterales bacterium]|nr:hypothetical protein [Ktedonobacterales bacterium]